MFSFGKPATQSSGGGGLFGQTNVNTSTNTNTGTGSGFSFNQNKPGTTLFGQSGNQGILGSSSNTGNTIGGGLFGSKPVNTSSSGSGGSGGLFGSKPLGTGLTTGSSGGLFGSKPTFGSGGTGLFGSQQQQQQPMASALESVSQLPVTPMTRISELPPQLKQEIEQLDQYTQKQVQICQHLRADATEHMELLESVPRDIAFLQKTQSQTNQLLAQDLKRISTIKDLTDQNINDTQTFSTMLQQLLTPGSKVSSMELDKFFQQKIQTYEKRLDEYTRVLSDIESVVNGICNEVIGEGSSGSGGVTTDSSGDNGNNINGISTSTGTDGMQATTSDILALKTGLDFIVNTVIEEFNLFMDIAQRIAEVHQKVKEIS